MYPKGTICTNSTYSCVNFAGLIANPALDCMCCLHIAPERRIGAPFSKGDICRICPPRPRGEVLRPGPELFYVCISNQVEELVGSTCMESFNPLVTMTRSHTAFSPECPSLLFSSHCSHARSIEAVTSTVSRINACARSVTAGDEGALLVLPVSKT